ncbi:MAG: sigma-70 family RNA polymerase sigma factor, partial [Nitrospirae bacterium]
GTVERHHSKVRYRANLILNVPGRTLVAKEEGPDGKAVIREAFLELERQLKKHKDFLRREHFWKRPARRETLRRTQKEPVETLVEGDVQLAWDVVMSNLDTLYNFVRRELAYYWATGDLSRESDLPIHEMLDRIMLRAVREFSQRPTHVELRAWLLKVAREEIAGEVQRLRQERALFVPLEEDIPEIPPEEEIRSLGEEIYEFYQPDEDLRLEDIVPNPRAISPEDISENRDLQRYINQTLAKLPKAWRDAFILHYVENFTIPEVAHIMGQPEEEVTRALEYAREFLQQTVEKAVESATTVSGASLTTTV